MKSHQSGSHELSKDTQIWLLAETRRMSNESDFDYKKYLTADDVNRVWGEVSTKLHQEVTDGKLAADEAKKVIFV